MTGRAISFHNFASQGGSLSKRPNTPGNLRAEAETQLARAPSTDDPAQSAEEVLHELRVHQIELQMQNEELRTSRIALEASRDRYVNLYEFSPVGYFTLTAAGQISRVNLTGTTLLGVERNKLLQQRFAHLISPEDRERWRGFFISVMNHDEKSGIELALQRSDGSMLHAHLDCLRVESADAPPEMHLVLTDISAMELNKQLRAVQHELREQLTFQTALMESVPVPIFFKDREGVYQGCNHAFEEALDRSRAQIIGKSVFDMASPEVANKYHAMDIDLLERPGKQTYEWVIQKASGEIRDVVFHKASFLRNDGSLGGLIGAVVDITDLKRKDAALLESEARLRAATETARDAIFMMEGESGTISEWNPAAETIFGFTSAEALGRELVDLLVPPRYHERALHGLSHFANPGDSEAAGRTLELTSLRKDGTEFPIELSLSAMQVNGKWFVTGIARDITARKLAENRLLESEQRFRMMADSAPIMIWMAEAQGHEDCTGCMGCNYFNQRWYEFTGMPREQKPSCGWQDVIHADDRKHFQAVYANAFLSKQPFKVEYRLRCHDGVFRWIEDSGVPRFSAGGEYLGFIGTCIDLTGRKLYEVIRGEMEHIDRLNIAGEMASGLAHELSQPLTSANTYLGACLRGMAEERWDSARLQRTVMLAHAQTERAGQIIKHLKELISKKEFERSMLDINSVIRDSIQFLDRELQQSMVQVTLHVSPLPPVRANKIEIEQVLINLIKNAIDSMCDQPRRELNIVTSAIESGSVLVKISDTGKGIAEEDMDKVFDAFHTSKKDGLGLGLAICRSLVENYGGKIWVEQKEDEGIEFNFTLSVGADL